MARPNQTEPQVFISFRGDDVRRNFVSHLSPALRRANIKVFIDADETLGTDLAYLLTRIEESEVALVVFSMNYADSYWCLEELAKMKELKDQNRLVVVPIFYLLQPRVVKELRGDFGDAFRDLKRKHLHQPEKTQKWEEALVSIPDIIGMPQSEQSHRTDYEFIDLLVGRIQVLLDQMAERGNPAREANREQHLMGPFMVPARQVEREANPQGGLVVPPMVLARQLDITHSKDGEKWAWSFINEPPSNAAIEIATMIKIYWLKIFGTFETRDLTPGTKYEAVFVVKLEDDAAGWEQPVNLKLKVEQHDGSERRRDRTSDLRNYKGHGWVDILAGVFTAPPQNAPAKITFTMFQYVDSDMKNGLVVKGVAIRPTN